MNVSMSPRQAALDYLGAAPDAPWRWDDGGAVLVWHDGTTLAFREEIGAMLQSFEVGRLPQFSAVVLFLAACKGKFPETSFARNASTSTEQQNFLRLLRGRQYTEAVAELARLTIFPPALLGDVAGKASVLSILAETLPSLTTAAADLVRAGMGERFSNVELNTAVPGAPFQGDVPLTALAGELKKYTAASLALRRRTGLNILPGRADGIDLPPQQQVRNLLKVLAQSAEHAGLARAVQDIMAAIRLPRAITQSNETASGGAAELGNRGSLDRLLLSELAHDDLTLAARVALNEALYIKREPPASQPPRSLEIIFDAGLRMWGVPRLLGTAAALGLLHQFHSSDPPSVFRASRGGLVPANLLSPAGLEEHLAALETNLQPSLAGAGQLTQKRNQAHDLVVITHRDNLRSLAFQQELRQIRSERAFLLLVDREGLIELFRLPWGSPRPLAQARIAVARLSQSTAPSISAPSLIDDQALTAFPIFFSLRPCPIAMPVNGKVIAAIPIDNGGACVTSNRRFLRWRGPGLGAQQIAAGLPGGSHWWLGADKLGRAVLVRGPDRDGLATAVLERGDSMAPKTVRFPAGKRGHAWIQHETLVVAHGDTFTAINLGNGEIAGKNSLPSGASWISGRYYRTGAEIMFPFWNGAALDFETVPPLAAVTSTHVLCAFDRAGVGAWFLLRDGRLFNPEGNVVHRFDFPLKQANFLTNPDRLILLNGDSGKWIIYRCDNAKIFSIAAPPASPAIVTAVPTRNVRTAFDGIEVTADGMVRLLPVSGQCMELDCETDALRLSAAKDLRAEAKRLRFQVIKCPANFGCELRVAVWPNGSKAWLDSRGLLHLRSPDREIPEISIVLVHEANVAVWCSDGQISGAAYYFGTAKAGNGAQLALAAFCGSTC